MSAHGRNNTPSICDDLPQSPGVYILWFDGQARAYIGGSVDVQRRVKVHCYEMRVFKSHKMHDDLNRYGVGRLRAAVLCHVDRRTDLPHAETRHIDEYRRGGWEIYNTERMGKLHRDWSEVQQ